MEPSLHPDCEPLAFLLGTWRGQGEGEWPRGEPFHYGEEITFEHVGDAFLVYAQRAWMLEDGASLHAERGFIRPSGRDRVELVLAYPLGLAEVAEGTCADGVIETSSTSVSRTSSGSHVTELRRRIEVRNDRLRYELHMAMHDVAVMRHLASELHRV